MKKFRKVWTDEINEWLKSTKGMKTSEAYALFLETYPDITDVTRCAFCNQRSRMRAAGKPTHNLSRKPRPLYSEQQQKGYIRIKIAQPSVWVSKAKWVYMETHPWEDFTERSNYVFLDGNNRNFDPANIERVPIRCMGVFNLMGGCEYGKPEITRLRILQTKLKVAMLDRGEKIGIVANYSGNRMFKEEINRKARERNYAPERRKKRAEATRLYYERIKTEDPARWEEIRERHKAYCHEYYKKKKVGK